jgi:hypothetical protein
MKTYLMYIGDYPTQIRETNRQFVIEIDGPVPESGTMKGKVVRRNKGAAYEIGYYAENWTNPKEWFKVDGFISFVQIGECHLDSMFPQ